MICRQQPRINRRRIDDRFKAGARLTEGLRRPVELALCEVVPANQRQHLARFRVHTDDSPLALQPLHRIFSSFLHFQIQGGINLHTARIHKIRTVLGQQIVEQDMRHEVRRAVILLHPVRRMAENQFRVVRLVALLVGNPAERDEPVQNVSLSALRIFKVRKRAVAPRSRDKTCDYRRLGEGQLGGSLPEIRPCGRINAPGAVAEVDRIQVHLHNPVLGKNLLHAYCKDDLFDFSVELPLLGKKEVSRQLLRNGASSLTYASVGDVFDKRACYRQQAETAVLIKRRVLRGKRRLNDPRRDIAQLHRLPVFGEQPGDRFAVPIVNNAGDA